MKESEKGDKYIDPVEIKKKKKPMEYEGDSDTCCNWCTWNNPQKIDKETRKLRNPRKRRGHPDNKIIKIAQNTENCPGDLRRLAVIHAPERNHQLTQV